MPILFTPSEDQDETRVAMTPDTAKRLIGLGLQVRIELGAGTAAGFLDSDYAAVGAECIQSQEVEATCREAQIVLAVSGAHASRLALGEGTVLVSFVQAAREPEALERLLAKKINTLAMELVPRISRAQAMDALSSQATVAGYKAVLIGASHLKKLCPLLMTAAGTVPPAKVVVFGAGVAGLQAIATARRLGCVVEATDVRMAAKEQVESLGARFIEVPGGADMEDAGGYAREQTPEEAARQREEVAKRVAEADLVITTAQIPGRAAPVLVDEDMVRSMQAGAVIVDMAVESGGNCSLSELGQVVVREGVTIVGTANIPGTVPQHASELYARNVLNLVKLFVSKEDAGCVVALDFEDEVLKGCLLTRAGERAHPSIALPGEPPPAVEKEPAPDENAAESGAEAGGTDA